MANDSRQSSYERAAREALKFWSAKSSTYTKFNAEFKFVPNASSADITLRFVNTVEDCPDSENITMGCAPVYDEVNEAYHTSVEIRGDYTQNTTLEIIKHEIGHTLGLEHGMEPMPTMAALDSNARQLPVTDAVDRSYPWKSKTLTVYLEAGPGVSKQKARAHLDEALKYYENGAGGWTSANVSFRYVSSNESANLSFYVTSSNKCGYEKGGYLLCELTLLSTVRFSK